MAATAQPYRQRAGARAPARCVSFLYGGPPMGTRMSSIRALAALAFSTVALLGFAASAHAELYWVNADTNTIGRSTLTGASANQSFISSSTTVGGGVAVDASHVYWGSWSGFIGRANVDGTNAENNWISLSTDSAVSVAVDSQYVYWTYANTPGIGRAKLDG